MALAQRFKNMTAYLHPAKMTAAFGLLSSEQRRAWVGTVGAPAVNEIELADAYPWYAFAAIHYLEELLSSETRVLEYGSGYSTLWFSKRVGEVVSVERSSKWLGEVETATRRWNLDNVRLVHFDKLADVIGEPEPDVAASRANEITAFLNCSGAARESFDIVVVDDICRNAVVAEAIHWVKPGGMLILDDSERVAYRPAFEALDGLGWRFASFFGTPPYIFHEKETTIWFKPRVA